MTTETKQQPSLAEIYAAEALNLGLDPHYDKARIITWPALESPHQIGRDLIVACNARRGWYKKPEVSYESLPQAPAHRGDGLSIDWRRMLTEAQRDYPGAQVFDRSSDYLAAARDASLPWGPPVWEQGAECVKEPGKALRAGLWHVQVEYAGSPWNGYDLPAVCEQGDNIWLWTPSVRAAQECGYRIEPAHFTKPGGGAIVWPDQHPLLRTWAERVWTARRALEENNGSDEIDRWPIPQARREAIELVKAVYKRTIGKFGDNKTSERLADEEYGRRAPAWYRPEWLATIKAEALAYSFAVMRRAVARGHAPLWAWTDTLGFAAPDLFLLPVGLANEAGLFTAPGRLGAWHFECSVPMEELTDPEPHAVRVEGRSAGLKLPAVRMRA